MKLAVGQVWRTRAGGEVKIVKQDPMLFKGSNGFFYCDDGNEGTGEEGVKLIISNYRNPEDLMELKYE